MTKKSTTKEFIEKAKQVHGDKYDYSKVEYVRSSEKVCIICPEHGEFWQTPNAHLKGSGCSKCPRRKRQSKFTTESFITEAKKIHGNMYDYSKTRFTNAQEKVVITCPIHGDFKQRIYDHLKGNGCPLCHGTRRYTVDEFINRARQIHGDKYNYSSISEYVNNTTPLPIICPIHGKFYQTPLHHINSRCGCPKCSESKGEREIEQWLIKNKIKYIHPFVIENIPKDIRTTGIIKPDFYLPSYNLIIEYNGKQHYIPQKGFGGQIKFESQIKRDSYLRSYCLKHGIKLLEIPYTEKDIICQIRNVIQ